MYINGEDCFHIADQAISSDVVLILEIYTFFSANQQNNMLNFGWDSISGNM